METLLLTRHAESESGARGEINGDLLFPSPLTGAGQAQARSLARSLAGEPVDLCVTSEFPRTIETAELALDGRTVPRLVLPDLNEIGFGAYEGGPLSAYREWAVAHRPEQEGPGGAEPRAEAARRFARGFRTLLAREERALLAVTHALAIRYLLSGPAPFVESVPLATLHRFSRAELEAATARLEAWAEAPSW